MTKIMIVLMISFCVWGCGASYKSQTEVKEKEHIVPAIQTIDTVLIPVFFDTEDSGPCNPDSIGRAYLEKYCKGTADIDKDGLKAKISFLVREKGTLTATIIQLSADIEAKERKIKTLDTTKIFTGYTKADVSAAKLSGGYWGAGITLLSLAGLIGIGIFFKSKFGILAKFFG